MKADRRRSWILLGCVLLTAGVLFGVFQLLKPTKPGARIEVLVQGERFGIFDLSEDREIPILDYCVLSVRDGSVSVCKSGCPRQTCVHHRPVSADGETIVCLPNRVVIRVIGGPEPETDYVL